MLGRSGRMAEVVGGVDEGDVGERLRKVADLPPRARVVLLGEQADVVAQREQPLEQRPRLVVAPLQDVVVGEPEAAGEERALRPPGSPSTLRPCL